MKRSDNPLNSRYSYHMLLYLREKGEVPISSLTPDVSTSYRAVRDLVGDLEEVGLIDLNKQFSPKRKFTVSLTDIGEKVADKLIEIEKMLED